jgi:N-acylneuraminate cytidylyltransferase/CMP-N,N'-diacetyllegionaminic acid synthase
VSTDDEEIASVARDWGGDVPFARPTNLAQDTSSHIEVVVHAVEWLGHHRMLFPDYVMLLQPTVPLRSTVDIDAAIDFAVEMNADSVISICPSTSHPYLVKKIGDDGRLEDFLYHIDKYLPRQSLPPAYVLNGAIYLVRREVLLEKRTWYTDRTYAYLMPLERSFDIDSELDFALVNLILKGELL